MWGRRRGLRTACLFLPGQFEEKKKTGYSNEHNDKHPDASREKKKNHLSISLSHTHTEIFSNSQVSLLNSSFIKEWPEIVRRGFKPNRCEPACGVWELRVVASNTLAGVRKQTGTPAAHEHSARATYRTELRGSDNPEMRTQNTGIFFFLPVYLIQHSCFLSGKYSWVRTVHSCINDGLKKQHQEDRDI